MAIAWLIRKPFVVEHHGYQAICPNGLLFREPSRKVCPGYFGQEQYGMCVRCASETMGFAGGLRSVLLTFPRRWLSKKVDANITISEHVATRLKLPRSRTIYYGIEESNSVSSGASAAPSSLLEIAYVGRLVVEKGPEILLHAAQLFGGPKNGIKVVFIGDGPERRRLEELAESLHLKEVVRFAGDLRGPDLDRAVSNVGVVVMPSLCEETAGLSAIEQMMRGRVVIAADIGGLSEIVGDAGLKFAPGDSRALAACIERVIADPSLAASLGSAARVRAMRLFSRDSMVEGHYSLYREAWLEKVRTRGSDIVE
jgi:glycosyltransferase involved in cell wall biosynthesis